MKDQAKETETLTIEGFAGLKSVTLDLRQVNVLIGPQASGKSVIAKLLFFFKGAMRRLTMAALLGKNEVIRHTEEANYFTRLFPTKCWPKASLFRVHYQQGVQSYSIEQGHPKAYQLAFSDAYKHPPASLKDLFGRHRNPRSAIMLLESLAAVSPGVIPELINGLPVLGEHTYFIPAGRSFFATLQRNIFSILSGSSEIDPFLTEFGRLYEVFRAHAVPDSPQGEVTPTAVTDDKFVKILIGRHVIEDSEDVIETPDGRKIPLSLASSGQQEVLPLLLSLDAIPKMHKKGRVSAFIEEPEAHLFPTSQREIIHFLSSIAGAPTNERLQFTLTTHSPYILAALNNTMYASQLLAKFPKKKAAITKAIGKGPFVKAENVGAWLVQGGEVRSIIDGETGLIQASVIDEVSGVLGQEFENLMAIEFGGRK